MSDLISRCELFNRLATIPASPEANELKAQYMYEQNGYQVCRDCMAKVADFIEPKPTK